MWEIETEGPTIVTTYGQLDGNKQIARDKILEGKNIGRSNETTPTQQAEVEAMAGWILKQKKGYVLEISDATDSKVNSDFITGGISPMLAQSYAKHASKIVYPAFMQPKLDGHRCIAVIEGTKATLWTRTRKPITGVPHIIRDLEALSLPDCILDGELYSHDYREKFEELTSFIKRPDPKPGHEVVQYHMYDRVSEQPFWKRAASIPASTASLVAVHTAPVATEDEALEFFEACISEGYEGAMIRNSNSPYENKRSYNLQKVKEFSDAEFTVVGVEEGRGKMAGKAIFVCKTSGGETFGVKMKGALDSLTVYLTNSPDYIGKSLTVQYQALTAKGIPRFPIGLRFREDI